MNKQGKRGLPIGAFTSQPIGNFVVNRIDHFMKENLHIKNYRRYCDDTVMMVATKKEAVDALKQYDKLSREIGLVVKASAIISPIGNEIKNERNNRRRKRSKRTKH